MDHECSGEYEPIRPALRITIVLGTYCVYFCFIYAARPWPGESGPHRAGSATKNKPGCPGLGGRRSRPSCFVLTSLDGRSQQGALSRRNGCLMELDLERCPQTEPKSHSLFRREQPGPAHLGISRTTELNFREYPNLQYQNLWDNVCWSYDKSMLR